MILSFISTAFHCEAEPLPLPCSLFIYRVKLSAAGFNPIYNAEISLILVVLQTPVSLQSPMLCRLTAYF